MTVHTIRPGIGYGSVAGQALGPASPADRDATGGPLADRRDEPTDRIRSLTLQLQAETKAEREAFTTELAKAIRNARRISLEDHHPVGVRRYAEEVAEALEPKLLGMRALMEREG